MSCSMKASSCERRSDRALQAGNLGIGAAEANVELVYIAYPSSPLHLQSQPVRRQTTLAAESTASFDLLSATLSTVLRMLPPSRRMRPGKRRYHSVSRLNKGRARSSASRERAARVGVCLVPTQRGFRVICLTCSTVEPAP